MSELKVMFVDFKAAASNAGPLPVDIGWCDVDGCGESRLIPRASDATATPILPPGPRGVTRAEPNEDGGTIGEVAHQVVGALGSREVLAISDSPTQDQHWLDGLLAAGGVTLTIRLEPLLENILAAGTFRVIKEEGLPRWPFLNALRDVLTVVEQAIASPSTDGALAGAQRNAAIWRSAMQRIDQARMAQKASPSGHRPRRRRR
jgi:hypothetical protein